MRMHGHGYTEIARLIQPRRFGSISISAHAGIPWAADNDCFQELNIPRLVKMLRAIQGLPGCLFIVVPDVVGDHAATLKRWHRWYPIISQFGPCAFALQDGVRVREIPWKELDVLFIGGTTDFKLGYDAAKIARYARSHGIPVHMGRVNTQRRIRYAHSLGCTSFDGTKWGMFPDTWIHKDIAYLRSLLNE